jgi:acyl-CoA reductase-like NAD-dependent aldehyde dehydrogenase
MTNKNPFPMIPIPKTPKCFIGGAFVRSESGRVTPLSAADGTFLCNIPLCSRKDLRNAVEAAAAASGKWAGTTPYLRGQILYRLAEMLDARAIEMTAALNVTDPAMEKNHRGNALEVRSTVERIVHFAGWTDKYQQVLGTVNPVSSPHFNFTIIEPVGIAGIIASDEAPLLGLLSLILPALVAGNTVVAVTSRTHPLPAILLGEILATSDFPAGTINLVTGDLKDLLPTMASHERIRSIAAAVDANQAGKLRTTAADALKRVRIHPSRTDWSSPDHNSPYAIRDFTEAKTVWHPVGW